MIRRLAKPAAIVLALACLSVATQRAEYLEALTANLADLLQPGAVLIEGDKTFSNFSFSSFTDVGPGGTASVLGASAITVTTGSAGGLVTLSVPLNMSVSIAAGGEGNTIAAASLLFDVSVTGSDVISGVTLAATGASANLPPGDATVATNFSSGGTNVGFSLVVPPGSDPTAIPNLQTLGVDTTASLIAEEPGDSGQIDQIVFTFQQTTPGAPVPEPGSLTLMVGGVGMLLARALYRRKA